MTDETEHTDDDLAAEYVLGVLDADTRAQVAHRVAIDHGFARLVDGWEQRLSGMNEAYLEIDPPSRVKEA
ncbi:MAG: anti-sigma factor, partial [Pseudomonadota bacterium]